MQRLEVQPKFGGGIKCLSEKPGRLRRDPALASDEFINPLHRHTDVVCKCDLCDAERSEKLLVQYLAGMCGDSVGGNHRIAP